MAPNGIRLKAWRSQAANSKAKTKAIVPRPGGQAFAFKATVTFHNMHKDKSIKGYFAML